MSKKKKKKFEKLLTKKLPKGKKIFKKSTVTVSIPEHKVPSVLGDENRFFKGQLKEEFSL